MEKVREQGTWLQCTHCGHIYHIGARVPIDRLYVASACPRCDAEVGLNCGDKREDVYLYYDPALDERFYNY